MTDKQLIAKLLGALTRLKIEIVLSDIDMDYIESHFRPHLDAAEAAIAATEGRMPNVYSIAAAEAREGVPHNGAFRRLIAAANRIEADACEVEGDDGWAMEVPLDPWHEFTDVLRDSRALLAKGDV